MEVEVPPHRGYICCCLQAPEVISGSHQYAHSASQVPVTPKGMVQRKWTFECAVVSDPWGAISDCGSRHGVPIAVAHQMLQVKEACNRRPGPGASIPLCWETSSFYESLPTKLTALRAKTCAMCTPDWTLD